MNSLCQFIQYNQLQLQVRLIIADTVHAWHVFKHIWHWILELSSSYYYFLEYSYLCCSSYYFMYFYITFFYINFSIIFSIYLYYILDTVYLITLIKSSTWENKIILSLTHLSAIILCFFLSCPSKDLEISNVVAKGVELE